MYRKEPYFRRLRRRFLTGRAARAAAGIAVFAAVALGAGGTAPAIASPRVPRWIHVAAGGSFSCGIRQGNTLWCWGGPDDGDLGTGAETGKLQPQQITNPTAGWVSVAAGTDHACALRKDGTLWCWGDNGEGEIGIGTTANVSRPHKVTTPAPDGWAGVSAGSGHTCATRTDTTLWCWGLNYDGQLGLGDVTSQDLPQQVTTPAADGWASVAAGAGHTCAIRGDATLWCWGLGFDGQLGLGTATDQYLPQQVTTPAADGWTSVAGGGFHTCAARADTTLWCWGYNLDGELGAGDTTGQLAPRWVPVPIRTGWIIVTAGDYHTCAIRTGHTLWCWGYNAAGELGLGSTASQQSAQQVTA